jgi:hypothetical protein
LERSTSYPILGLMGIYREGKIVDPSPGLPILQPFSRARGRAKVLAVQKVMEKLEVAKSIPSTARWGQGSKGSRKKSQNTRNYVFVELGFSETRRSRSAIKSLIWANRLRLVSGSLLAFSWDTPSSSASSSLIAGPVIPLAL